MNRSQAFSDLVGALEKRRANHGAGAEIVRAFTRETAVAHGAPEQRTLRFVASDETWDRYDTVLRVDGWELENYRKNPVFLWAHETRQPPIGKTVEITKGDGRLVHDVQFASRDEYEFADTAYRLFLGGFLRGVSVGFSPIEWNLQKDDQGNFTRVEFTKQELIELSAVPVPGNPNSLMQAVRSGAVSQGDAAGFVARCIYGDALDLPGSREALGESVRRFLALPDGDKQTLLALRSFGANRPARTASQTAPEANHDWDAPLSELRAINERLAKR